MKKITYYITTLFLVTAALGLSSCLKNSKYYVDVSKGVPLVELPLEARNLPGNLVAASLPISATPQVFQVAVNLASVNALSSPLNVTLAVDPDAATTIATYNHANGLDTGGNVPYTLLPAADYSIPNPQVTIPAGQHVAYLNINVNTNIVDVSGSFILPIKIVNGGGQQISNYNELLLHVAAENQYDGEYVVTGTLSDNTDATIIGAYPETVYLETTGPNSDIFIDKAYGVSEPAHEISTSAGISAYGSFAPVFTFTGSAVQELPILTGNFRGRIYGQRH
jgi:Domain of unknown function (DUF1735)